MGSEEQVPLGERIRRWRAAEEVSQSVFTVRVQRAYRKRGGGEGRPTPGYIAQIERGESHPTLPVLEALADVMGLEPTAIPEYRIEYLRELLNYRPPTDRDPPPELPGWGPRSFERACEVLRALELGGPPADLAAGVRAPKRPRRRPGARPARGRRKRKS